MNGAEHDAYEFNAGDTPEDYPFPCKCGKRFRSHGGRAFHSGACETLHPPEPVNHWTDLAARDPELYEVVALAKHLTEDDEPLELLDMLEAAVAEWELVASGRVSGLQENP